MLIDGACHCGAVSFTAQIDPSRVVACHCSDCQVLSGAPFRTVALAPIESLRVEGTTKAYVKLAQSGNRRAQVFCPECATPLWSIAPENPTTVAIRLGCVSQRAQLAPSLQIWHGSALPWLSGLDEVPKVAEGSGFSTVVEMPAR
ncbi:MAG: GFA family protein [Ideonella sp.]